MFLWKEKERKRKEVPSRCSAGALIGLTPYDVKHQNSFVQCLLKNHNAMFQYSLNTKRSVMRYVIRGTVYWGHCKLKLTMNANQVKCWFLRRGETGVPGENLSVQRREPTNSTHI